MKIYSIKITVNDVNLRDSYNSDHEQEILSFAIAKGRNGIFDVEFTDNTQTKIEEKEVAEILQYCINDYNDFNQACSLNPVQTCDNKLAT